MSIRTQTPVEIDTKLAELYAREAKARRQYESMRKANEQRRLGRGYLSFSEDEGNEAYNALRAIIEDELPLEAEYERRPWQRYWHVTNNNGHIHTSRACSSCFPTTQYGWRTDLSGLRDIEVVEREAYNACSVCMPIAPAEQKAARTAHTKAQREAKAAERQTKADTKDAKGRERASKLVDKVETAIEKIGGWEVFCDEYASHTNRFPGKKSLYAWCWDPANKVQQTVGDALDAIKNHQEGDDWHLRNLNKYVKAELTTRGLI